MKNMSVTNNELLSLYFSQLINDYGIQKQQIITGAIIPVFGNDIWKEIIKFLNNLEDIKNLRLLSKWFHSFCEKERFYIFQIITGMTLKDSKLKLNDLFWFMNIITKFPEDNFLIGTNAELNNFQDYCEKQSNVFVCENTLIIKCEENNFYIPLWEIGLAAKRGTSKSIKICPTLKVFSSDGIFCFQIGENKGIMRRNWLNGIKTCGEDKSSTYLCCYSDNQTIERINEKKLVYFTESKAKTSTIFHRLNCNGICKTKVQNYQLIITLVKNATSFTIDLEKNIKFIEKIYDFSGLNRLSTILNHQETIKIHQNEKYELIFHFSQIVLCFKPIEQETKP